MNIVLSSLCPLSFSLPLPLPVSESLFTHLTFGLLSVLRMTLLTEWTNLCAPAKPCAATGLPLTVIHKSTTPQHRGPRLYSTACSMITGVQASQHLAQPATMVGGTNSPEHKGVPWMGDRCTRGHATWEEKLQFWGTSFPTQNGKALSHLHNKQEIR